MEKQEDLVLRSFYIDKKTDESLRDRARLRGTSKAELVREILAQKLT